MPNWSRLRGRLKLRIRTLLLLIAVFAMGLGAALTHLRQEERRRRWPYEILNAAELGDVPRIRRLLDEGADVDSVTDGRYPWTPLTHASFHGKTDPGTAWNVLPLADTPAATPVKTFDPYLGDYDHLVAVGPVFYGIFSANNTPDPANFPSGVKYQRNADFNKRRLLALDNTTAVDASIDPFFFKVTGV
jgi:hypothetical protein